MELNDLLKKALAKSGQKKSQVSKILGVSRAHVTQLLEHGSNPTLRTVRDFLAVCGFVPEFSLKRRKPKTRTSLPAFLKPLFWDAAFESIHPSLHHGYVIQRVLDGANTQAWAWLFSVYSKRKIKGFFRKRVHRLSPRSRGFWALILGMEKEISCLPKNPRPFPDWRNLQKSRS